MDPIPAVRCQWQSSHYASTEKTDNTRRTSVPSGASTCRSIFWQLEDPMGRLGPGNCWQLLLLAISSLFIRTKQKMGRGAWISVAVEVRRRVSTRQTLKRAAGAEDGLDRMNCSWFNMLSVDDTQVRKLTDGADVARDASSWRQSRKWATVFLGEERREGGGRRYHLGISRVSIDDAPRHVMAS